MGPAEQRRKVMRLLMVYGNNSEKEWDLQSDRGIPVDVRYGTVQQKGAIMRLYGEEQTMTTTWRWLATETITALRCGY